MESVLRAIGVYLFLFIIFRASGKRSMMESSPFGMVLIFLISSSVADIMKDEDRSIINGIILALTLMLMHLIFSFMKSRSKRLSRIIEDAPTLLVREGEVFEQRLKEARVTREDILAAARKQKLGHLSEIKYAILEIDGSFSIIPQEEE